MKPVLIIALILSWVFFLSTGWPFLSSPEEPEGAKVSVATVDTQLLEEKVIKLEKKLADAEKVIESLTQLEGQISLLENEQDRLKAEAEEQSQKAEELASELAELENEEPSENNITPSISKSVKPSDSENNKKSDNPMAAMMKEMMKNDGMQEMVKMQVEQQFTQLWSSFAPDMTPELREVVLEKIKQRQLDQTMEGMKFFQMDGEERKAWSQKVKEDNENFDSELENLLGIEYAPLYQDYKSSLPARQQFIAFKQLGYAPQNPDSEAKVLEAFIAAQKTVSSQTPEDMPEAFDGESIDQHSNKVLDHQKLLMQEVLHETRETLSNEEHQQLSTRLEQYQKQMEVGLKMSRAFLGSEKEEEGNESVEVETVIETEDVE